MSELLQQTEENSPELQRIMRLEGLSRSISQKRDEAVKGRAASGIEQIWTEDEDYYNGDDVVQGATFKPKAVDGQMEKETSNRSTLSLNITRKYVDAGAAKVADMLLPTDDNNWAITATPIPNIEDYKDDETPVVDPKTMEIINAGGKPLTVKDHFEKMVADANKKVKNAEKRIKDWLVECNYNSEMRKVIEDAAKVGTGVLKGPVPTIRKATAVTKKDGMTTIEIKEFIAPESKRISYWNLYPDPNCGDDIHSGAYIFESDSLNTHQLEALKKDPTYIREALEAVLEEGPAKKYKNEFNQSISNNSKNDTYEVWYFIGYIDKDDLEAAGYDFKGKESDFESFPALITLINDRVVKATLHHLDSGKFPYDVMVWSKREGTWTGTGVSRQARTPQEMLDAVARNMMDNHGFTCGPQIFLKRGGVTPADGVWEITPNKLWFINDEEVMDARQAMQSIIIPSNQVESMGIINFALKMAEDVTGLPMLLQGQQGTAPDTVGGMNILNNNASTVLRRIARTFDDQVTEPHLRAYYEWLLLYSDNEDEKGDFQIEARGSSALVERDIQNQTIAQHLQLALNPAYGIDPKKAYREFLKSQRLDVKMYAYTEEELQKLQAQAQQTPPDPRIQTAQINNQTKIQLAQAASQESQAEIELRMQDAREDRQYRLQEMQLTREIEMLKLANAKNMSIEKIKADLTKAAMTIKNDREMMAAEINLKQQVGSGI